MSKRKSDYAPSAQKVKTKSSPRTDFFECLFSKTGQSGRKSLISGAQIEDLSQVEHSFVVWRETAAA